jgi:hypothetical protein
MKKKRLRFRWRQWGVVIGLWLWGILLILLWLLFWVFLLLVGERIV